MTKLNFERLNKSKKMRKYGKEYFGQFDEISPIGSPSGHTGSSPRSIEKCLEWNLLTEKGKMKKYYRSI